MGSHVSVTRRKGGEGPRGGILFKDFDGVVVQVVCSSKVLFGGESKKKKRGDRKRPTRVGRRNCPVMYRRNIQLPGRIKSTSQTVARGNLKSGLLVTQAASSSSGRL